jgi:hypothetical protein
VCACRGAHHSLVRAGCPPTRRLACMLRTTSGTGTGTIALSIAPSMLTASAFVISDCVDIQVGEGDHASSLCVLRHCAQVLDGTTPVTYPYGVPVVQDLVTPFKFQKIPHCEFTDPGLGEQVRWRARAHS